MKPLKKRIDGFSLIEILIVIVALAVLAAIAVPMYQTTIEKSRKREAYAMLAAIRASQLRYYTANNAFTTDLTRLDFDPTQNSGGQTSHFTYCMSSADSNTFIASALRNTQNTQGLEGTLRTVIQINQAGAVNETASGRFSMGPGGNMGIYTAVPQDDSGGICVRSAPTGSRGSVAL
jgi:type IV pilus assembly protein PilE